jgi:hypothetical protein
MPRYGPDKRSYRSRPVVKTKLSGYSQYRSAQSQVTTPQWRSARDTNINPRTGVTTQPDYGKLLYQLGNTQYIPGIGQVPIKQQTPSARPSGYSSYMRKQSLANPYAVSRWFGAHGMRSASDFDFNKIAEYIAKGAGFVNAATGAVTIAGLEQLPGTQWEKYGETLNTANPTTPVNPTSAYSQLHYPAMGMDSNGNITERGIHPYINPAPAEAQTQGVLEAPATGEGSASGGYYGGSGYPWVDYGGSYQYPANYWKSYQTGYGTPQNEAAPAPMSVRSVMPQLYRNQYATANPMQRWVVALVNWKI